MMEISDREVLADWIETTLLVRGRPIGHDALFAIGSSELNVSEAQIALALQTVGSRATTLGPVYPFEPQAVGLRVRGDAATSPYSILLLLSPGGPTRQLIEPTPSEQSIVLFERLVVEAMKRLLGPQSEALRFGWPSDEGRPQEFHLAIEWLAARMGIKSGLGYRPPRRKDGGVDVVAWRPFIDGRSGFPVFLLQCTLQGRLIEKALDIDVRIWSSWLTLDSEPSTVLAVPGTIGREETWNEIALRCLILDRIRLAGLLDCFSLGLLPGAVDFVSGQLTALADCLVGAQS